MGQDKNEARDRHWKKPLPGVGSLSEGVEPEHTAPDREEILRGLPALRALCARDGGWLRFAPDFNGGLVYLKWKWTVGRLANRYVMAVGTPDEVELLLAVLYRKVCAAEDGTGATAADRYFGGGGDS